MSWHPGWHCSARLAEIMEPQFGTVQKGAEGQPERFVLLIVIHVAVGDRGYTGFQFDCSKRRYVRLSGRPDPRLLSIYSHLHVIWISARSTEIVLFAWP